MKSKIVKVAAVLFLAVFAASSVAPCVFAQSPVRKLGRGLANVATGFLELPQNIVDVGESEGATAAVTYGIARGLAMSVLRTGVGIYETITFLIPVPWKYAPILEPEFMMGSETF